MKRIIFGLLISFFALTTACQTNQTRTDVFTVHFDTCTEMETNYIEDQEVKPGEYAIEPSVVFPYALDTPTKISGWYIEKSYKTKWDFENNPVNSNLTLYAKWANIISINYYLKGSSTPIWVVNDALDGNPLQRHDELCDGYEFYGYFKDSSCTEPFDLDEPLHEDTDVYLYRGDTFSMNPYSIKRRFRMVAAGGSGSSAGNISNVLMDKSGVECVDVNFGYSTSADPYMLISNPQIDISHSQKIKIKFKNFGGCTSVAFYWVSQYADGSYSSNTVVDNESNSAHFRINSYECYMTEDDPWIEREFDLSKTLASGVSPWANSVTLVHLRIQFSYISRNPSDLSNVIRIASITSIPDDTYKGFNDSKQIKEMLFDDTDEALNNASAAQEQNRGVIFPKNNNLIEDTSTTYYKKTNGLLLYSKYGEDVRRYFFDVHDQNIEADKFSFVSIKFRNLSYISAFTFYVTVITPSGATKNTITNVSMPIRMKGLDETTINLYGKDNMIGIIKSFSILFNYNGVDNAILLQSITLSKSKSFQIPGFNFDDEKFAGFTSNEEISLAHNKQLTSTSFTSSLPLSTIQFDLPYQFDITPYHQLALRYFYKDDNISSLSIKLKINNNWKEYIFDEFSISDELKNDTKILETTGILQSIQLIINGQGSIDISAIEFVLNPETSCDLSDPYVYGGMLSDWAISCNYVEDKRATLFNDGSNPVRYYFGFLYKASKREFPNIPLINKSYIYVIYQNQKNYGSPYMNIFATNSDLDKDYLTSFSESAPFIAEYNLNIAKNMDENAWATVAIPIPDAYKNGKYYLSNFFLGSRDMGEISLYIRGIAVI